MSFDTNTALTAQPPLCRESGSESPVDPSSRSSTPGCNSPEHGYQSWSGPSTRPSSSHHFPSQSTTTSISELSQYFTRHSLQSQQRRSTPNPLDYTHTHAHAPLGLYRPHDQANLALLSTTHAHRIARRKQSLKGLQCNPKHLHRVASLAAGIMERDDGELTIAYRGFTSQPSSVSLSEDSSSSSGGGGSDHSSLTSLSSPESEEGPDAGYCGVPRSSTSTSVSAASSYFPSPNNTNPEALESSISQPPKSSRPSSPCCSSNLCSCRLAIAAKDLKLHTGRSNEKVLRPIRMRRRPRRESLVAGGGGGGGRR